MDIIFEIIEYGANRDHAFFSRLIFSEIIDVLPADSFDEDSGFEFNIKCRPYKCQFQSLAEWLMPL